MAFEACASHCQVLQDVQTGWEDHCLGLQLFNASTTAEECQQWCCNDPNCEVWQWGNKRDYASRNSLGQCYIGKGLECSSDRMDDFLVLAGQRQRIEHGSVDNTVKLDIDKWCTGAQMRQATGLNHLASFEQVVSDCREACYSDATCSIWEYSGSRGCWYGVADDCTARALDPGDMAAGEHVGRICGESVSGSIHADYYMVFGILGAVAFLLTLVASIVLAIHTRADTRQPLMSPMAKLEDGDGALLEDGCDFSD